MFLLQQFPVLEELSIPAWNSSVYDKVSAAFHQPLALWRTMHRLAIYPMTETLIPRAQAGFLDAVRYREIHGMVPLRVVEYPPLFLSHRRLSDALRYMRKTCTAFHGPFIVNMTKPPDLESLVQEILELGLFRNASHVKLVGHFDGMSAVSHIDHVLRFTAAETVCDLHMLYMRDPSASMAEIGRLMKKGHVDRKMSITLNWKKAWPQQC
jgi:hypothetical protein